MANTPYGSSFEEQHDPDRAQEYTILRLISRVHTAQLVRVMAVEPVADRVGFVTCQPVIQDTATNGVLIAQSPIYRVPYLRVQGGVSALIIDPAEGDIGVALFAERDITAFKDTLQDGAAATERQFSSGDALYLGGFLNGAPAQYVRLRPGAGGIDVITPGAMNLQAGGVATLSAAQFVVNAPTTFNDTVSGTKAGAGNYSFPNLAVAGVNLETHKHTNVQPGTGNSGGPTN